MNTDKLNQQQLFGEPQYVEGTAGKKQVFGEPQYVTGREKHAEQLTPLYTEPQHGLRNPFLSDQEQLHGVHNASGGGDWQKIPVYSEKEQLYPGQEQFLPGKEHLTSGGTFQTGEHTKKTEHLGLSPDKEQHVQPSTPHVHLNPSEHIRLPPDAEHVHIKLGTAPEAGVEQVIRIKSDGRVLVNTEKVGEHGTSTEHLKEHGHGTEHLKTEHVSHDKEKLSTEHKKSLGTEHGHGKKEHGHGTKEHGIPHKDYDTSLTDALHKPRAEHETEHLHTQESKKKRLSNKGKHHDKTTETQTVVKVKKHEPGTAGRKKERKHDTK